VRLGRERSRGESGDGAEVAGEVRLVGVPEVCGDLREVHVAAGSQPLGGVVQAPWWRQTLTR
jgi:hypothetical protein